MNGTAVVWLPWVQAIGWMLLHFVWQGLVIGAGFACARALIPKTHCNARYAAGLTALALMMFSAITTLLVLHPQQFEDDASITPIASATALVAAAGQASETDVYLMVQGLLPWLVLVWMAGVVVMAWRAARQWHALDRIVRLWAVPADELQAILVNLAQRFRFTRRIRVLVSERIDTPMLLGWLKPVILLPAAVALGFPRQQVELILAHELGHLRRYDHLVNLAQTLLETLFFYHPIVHWISQEVRNERELCCDLLVLRLTVGEPREYARTLAALEELRQPPAQVALAAGGGVLLERVRRIVGMPTPRLSAERPNPLRWLMAAALLTIAIAVTIRVERDGETRSVAGLTVDWLNQADIRALPIAALTIPFERPHLRLAQIAPIEADRGIANSVASVAVAPTVSSSVAPVPIAIADQGAVRESAVLSHPATAAPVVPEVPAPNRAAVDDAAAKPALSHPIQRAPILRRMVMPEFPSTLHSETGRVDVSFLIAANGSVRDIQVADERTAGAFARAAEHALQQWRFDPSSLSGDRNVRFRQSFVFAPGKKIRSPARFEADCVQSTGSHICRSPLEDGEPAMTTAFSPGS